MIRFRRSSSLAVAALLAAASVAGGQTAPRAKAAGPMAAAAPTGMDAGGGGADERTAELLTRRVRSEIARRWGVEEERIVLDPETLEGEGLSGASPGVELLGSGSGGHWIVRVAGEDGVAVGLHVRAGLRTRVPVAARPLSRGEQLSSGDVEVAEAVTWGEPTGADAFPEEGWVVQRALRQGEVLREPAVRPPLAVQSGREVDVVWARPGVAIKLRGRALGSGSLGAEVYVRTESGERLRGVVRAPGVVDVTPGGSDR